MAVTDPIDLTGAPVVSSLTGAYPIALIAGGDPVLVDPAVFGATGVVRVLSRTQASPPTGPTSGDAYIVPSGGTWDLDAGTLVIWSGSQWQPKVPTPGVPVWVADEEVMIVYDAGWKDAPQAAIDTAVDGLVDGAPSNLDTLKKLADAVSDKAPAAQGIAGDGLAATHAAAGSHTIAQISDLQAELNAKAGAWPASAESDGLMPVAAYTKLAGIEEGAQVNPASASQAEAEAGTDTAKMMSPLRTAQAIAASGIGSGAAAASALEVAARTGDTVRTYKPDDLAAIIRATQRGGRDISATRPSGPPQVWVQGQYDSIDITAAFGADNFTADGNSNHARMYRLSGGSTGTPQGILTTLTRDTELVFPPGVYTLTQPMWLALLRGADGRRIKVRLKSRYPQEAILLNADDRFSWGQCIQSGRPGYTVVQSSAIAGAVIVNSGFGVRKGQREIEVSQAHYERSSTVLGAQSIICSASYYHDNGRDKADYWWPTFIYGKRSVGGHYYLTMEDECPEDMRGGAGDNPPWAPGGHDGPTIINTADIIHSSNPHAGKTGEIGWGYEFEGLQIKATGWSSYPINMPLCSQIYDCYLEGYFSGYGNLMWKTKWEKIRCAYRCRPFEFSCNGRYNKLRDIYVFPIPGSYAHSGSLASAQERLCDTDFDDVHFVANAAGEIFNPRPATGFSAAASISGGSVTGTPRKTVRMGGLVVIPWLGRRSGRERWGFSAGFSTPKSGCGS